MVYKQVINQSDKWNMIQNNNFLVNNYKIIFISEIA